MYHAGNVEGNFRKQEIADNVLQTHDYAEQYLPDKEANSCNKIQLGDGL